MDTTVRPHVYQFHPVPTRCMTLALTITITLKATIHFLTQSCGLISRYGKSVERTCEIDLEMVSFRGN